MPMSTINNDDISTRNNEEQLTEVIEPEERQLLERKGFDRRQIRFELANVTQVDPVDQRAEYGGERYLHPETDGPVGPTTVTESASSGIEIVEAEKTEVSLHRFTNKISLNVEDQEIDERTAREKRNALMELFDTTFDMAFLTGVEDEHGNVIQISYLQWLKDHIPQERVIDASEEVYERAANIIVEDAYSRVTGELVQEDWGMMLGKHEALAQFRRYEDGDSDRTVMEMITDGNTSGISVGEVMHIPEKIALKGVDGEVFTRQVDDIGEDEVILLPAEAREEFVQIFETSEPMARGPMSEQNFKLSFEYLARHGVGFAEDRYDDATDAIRIVNVSDAF